MTTLDDKPRWQPQMITPDDNPRWQAQLKSSMTTPDGSLRWQSQMTTQLTAPRWWPLGCHLFEPKPDYIVQLNCANVKFSRHLQVMITLHLYTLFCTWLTSNWHYTVLPTQGNTIFHLFWKKKQQSFKICRKCYIIRIWLSKKKYAHVISKKKKKKF